MLRMKTVVEVEVEEYAVEFPVELSVIRRAGSSVGLLVSKDKRLISGRGKQMDFVGEARHLVCVDRISCLRHDELAAAIAAAVPVYITTVVSCCGIVINRRMEKRIKFVSRANAKADVVRELEHFPFVC